MLLPPRFLTIVLVVVGCSDARLTADQVLSSEQVIEALRLPLADLSKSVVNLQFPDERARGVFEPSLTVVDLADAADEDRQRPFSISASSASTGRPGTRQRPSPSRISHSGETSW